MFKIFKTFMFTFLCVLPSLVLFLINRMENTYNGFSIFKGNDQITKSLRWWSRKMISDRESFPYQFCIPMKKSIPHLWHESYLGYKEGSKASVNLRNSYMYVLHTGL